MKPTEEARSSRSRAGPDSRGCAPLTRHNALAQEPRLAARQRPQPPDEGCNLLIERVQALRIGLMGKPVGAPTTSANGVASRWDHGRYRATSNSTSRDTAWFWTREVASTRSTYIPGVNSCSGTSP